MMTGINFDLHSLQELSLFNTWKMSHEHNIGSEKNNYVSGKKNKYRNERKKGEKIHKRKKNKYITGKTNT